MSWGDGGTPPSWAPVLFAAIWIFVAAMMALFAFPLQRVHVSSTGLRISNYFDECRISWSALEAVEYAPLVRFENLPLARLRIASEGSTRSVLFIPADSDIMSTILQQAPPEVRARLTEPSA